jgi:preprotein translocase subunit SecG
MEIIPIQDMYNGDNATIVVISILLFILNTIVALIDTNTYIKDMGIGDRVISKGKFLYSYIGGYFTYFLKITVMIFTLYILLTIIRIAVITVFNIMKPLSGDGASSMSDGLAQTLFDKYKESLKDNALWLMGIYFIDMFIMAFVVFAPLLIFFIILGFSILIYENKSMKDLEDEGKNEKALQILNTVHHHMMFFISICVAILILYMIGLFSHNFANFNEEALSASP